MRVWIACMQETTMFIHACDSPEELLNICQRISFKKSSREWFFRGQSDSTWTLAPSLLRPKTKIDNAREFERSVLDATKSVLRDRTTLPDRLIDDDMVVLAMAQHYGVPTRCLDWTVDPNVALYFAASDAIRHRASKSLAVFAMARIYLELGRMNARYVSPPRAANPNLVAQRGRLVRVDWDHPDLWDDASARPVVDPVANVTALVDSRLVRLDLATTHAEDALRLLFARGVDGSVVFPGIHGMARFAEDMARLES